MPTDVDGDPSADFVIDFVPGVLFAGYGKSLDEIKLENPDLFVQGFLMGTKNEIKSRFGIEYPLENQTWESVFLV